MKTEGSRIAEGFTSFRDNGNDDICWGLIDGSPRCECKAFALDLLQKSSVAAARPDSEEQ